jgi:hypothetical protein
VNNDPELDFPVIPRNFEEGSASKFFVVDFEVTESSRQRRIPVDETVGAVDDAFFVKSDEDIPDSF